MLHIPTVVLLDHDPVSCFLLQRVLARVARVAHVYVAHTTPVALAHLCQLHAQPEPPGRVLILLNPYHQPGGGRELLDERTRLGLVPQAVVMGLVFPTRLEPGGGPPLPRLAACLEKPVREEALHAALQLFFPRTQPLR